jgi:hypothetical protein
MAGMPNPIEDSTSIGGAAQFFKNAEDWLNVTDPAQRRDRRTRARTSVGSFGGISPTTTLAGGNSAGGVTHFNQHWRGGSAGWWPRITAARVNSQMSTAFGSALGTVLTPGKEGLNIRLRWDCRNRDLNAVEYFYATPRETASEVWIEIVSPRAPDGFDLESNQRNYGFNPTSDLEPGSIGPFTALGDLEVANYDGTAGIDTSFDTDGEEMVRTEGFRESWSFFPIREPVENGSQVLTGLSYTRDSWRPVPGQPGTFEDESLHSETGYLLWDAGNGHAYRVIALPRGVTVLAVAHDVEPESSELRFVADADSKEPLLGGILSNPLVSESARTVRFTSTMQIVSGGSSFYYQDTAEQLRAGQEETVRHTDSNSLSRI